jgi:hypothetical protein
LDFLGGLVLGFLLSCFVLVDSFSFALFFGNGGFLSLLDLSDGLFSKCLFILRSGGFHFLDSFKRDTFDGSFDFEGFGSFGFSSVGYFDFFMKSSPSSGPSESLGFEFSESKMGIPETEVSGSFGKIQERSSVFSNVSDTLSWVDFPLAECAEFCFDNHNAQIIK